MSGLSNAVALLCRYGRGTQSESAEDMGEALRQEAGAADAVPRQVKMPKQC